MKIYTDRLGIITLLRQLNPVELAEVSVAQGCGKDSEYLAEMVYQNHFWLERGWNTIEANGDRYSQGFISAPTYLVAIMKGHDAAGWALAGSFKIFSLSVTEVTQVRTNCSSPSTNNGRAL